MPENSEPIKNEQTADDDQNQDMDDTGLTEEEWSDMTIEERNEYNSLQRALEQIDSCLDALERKNDTLNAQLRALLESNAQAREEIQPENVDPN